MRYSLCVLATLLGTAGVQAAPVAEPVAAPVVEELLPEKAGLKISILMGDIALLRSEPYISVILQNTSPKSLELFTGSNSWGYNNLTLEITKIDGEFLDKPLVIKQGMMFWIRNGPGTYKLSSGQSENRKLVLQVPAQISNPKSPLTFWDLNGRGPAYWKFPVPMPNETKKITMRAVFSNNDNGLAARGKKALPVWTGRIASPFEEYSISWQPEQTRSTTAHSKIRGVCLAFSFLP